MTLIELTIFLLFLATISVPIATKTRLPFELFLVAASAVISFIPGLPQFQLKPNVVFNLFLPPIIFSAAYFISWQDFKFNFRPISLLAFGLTTATAVVIAYITSIIIPGFTWAQGFLLGSVLSPTDATSAVAIIKKLGAKRRLIAVLEGESMLNDATALILFRFGVAFILLNTVSISEIASTFLIITLGGTLVGLIIGIISLFLLQKLHDVEAETVLTIITAFSCYLIAEHLKLSGVIATVVCGIYCGLHLHEVTSSPTRLSARASWQTMIFGLNCLAFTLIGIELPTVVNNLEPYSISSLIMYSLIIVFAILLIRLIWVFAVAYFSRKLVPKIAIKDPMPSWQMLFIISWASMRGIISLAAVLAIPLYTLNGDLFPQRNVIIFITYCVIVATLLIPSTTLPILVNTFNLTEDANEKLREEALARLRSIEAVMEKLEEIANRENVPENILNEFRNHFQRRLNIIKTQLSEFPFSTLNDDYSALRRLTLGIIALEREILAKLRKSGEIHNEIFHRLSDELDIEELRANSLRL